MEGLSKIMWIACGTAVLACFTYIGIDIHKERVAKKSALLAERAQRPASNLEGCIASLPSYTLPEAIPESAYSAGGEPPIYEGINIYRSSENIDELVKVGDDYYKVVVDEEARTPLGLLPPSLLVGEKSWKDRDALLDLVRYLNRDNELGRGNPMKMGQPHMGLEEVDGKPSLEGLATFYLGRADQNGRRCK